MIKLLYQELLGYQFSFVQCSHEIMKDLNALNCLYGPEIVKHLEVSAVLRQEVKFSMPE